MNDAPVAGSAGETDEERHAEGDQSVLTAKRKRRGVLTFALTAVGTAAVASGLIFGSVAIFGNEGGASPSDTGNTPTAHPDNGTSGNSIGQHGNGSGQGAAKAKAARDRAAAAKSRSSDN